MKSWDERDLEGSEGMEMPYISVIVPVFNVEAYVETCIRSIMEQTYRNLEIIIVDDGSTDNTGNICKSLAQEDDRIIVISQKNGGVVRARNTGIEKASGKYMGFVDGDDWIEKDMYEQMVKGISGGDLLCAGYVRHLNGKLIKCREKHVKVSFDSLEEMGFLWKNMMANIGTPAIMPYMTNKLLVTDIVRNVYQNVNEHIRFDEDGAFIYLYILECRSVRFLDIFGYHYVDRKGSARNMEDRYFFENIQNFYLSLYPAFEKHYLRDALISQLQRYVIAMLYLHLNAKLCLGDEARLLHYIYPYYGRLRGSRVVLYGAGKVGQDYYLHIKRYRENTLAGWVDKSYEKYQAVGLPVQPVKLLETVEYDYVILGIKDEEVVAEIRDELEAMGVEGERILWNRTRRIWEQDLKSPDI